MSPPLPSQTVIAAIEALAPPAAAAPWDHSGVQLVGRRSVVTSLAVCLEPSPKMIRAALAAGADFILSHHPLSMAPHFFEASPEAYRDAVAETLSAGAWLYSAHTSLDANPRGPAAWLAEELGLAAPRVLETTWRVQSRTFCILTDQGPDPAWRNLPGVLQSRVLGTSLVVTCEAGDWPAVREAIRASHLGHAAPLCLAAEPELPDREYGFGLIGGLPNALLFEEFCGRVRDLARPGHMTVCGSQPAQVRRVAICGGSGSSLAPAAFAAGADVLVTGDVKYHTALESAGCMLDVGHFSLEEEMMRRLARRLEADLPGLPVFFLAGADPFSSACAAKQ